MQDSTQVPEKTAGYFLTGTLAAFGVGRFTSAYLMRFISEKFHSIAWAYAVPLFSYVVIALYSFFGARRREALS